jgi:hypothetical protein
MKRPKNEIDRGLIKRVENTLKNLEGKSGGGRHQEFFKNKTGVIVPHVNSGLSVGSDEINLTNKLSGK